MKKKLMKFIVIGAIAVVGTIGYNISVNQESVEIQFMMKNAEALAYENGEDGSIIIGNCVNKKGMCLTVCPECNQPYRGKSGRIGPLVDVLGKCWTKGCGYIFH